jgi:uncharacterized protein YjbJ (UPF0337 family)
MSEDRVVGTGKNFAGQAEEAYGRATGNVRRELEGKARQAEGVAQDLYGQVKDKAAGAAEAVGEGVDRADDFLRDMIEQRPYTTAAVALAIGFLIGRFGRRDY